MAEPAEKPVEKASVASIELGTSGIRYSGGRIHDEFLPQLKGLQGVRTYREMSDNNAIIGASLNATEALVKRASWKWEASSQSPDAMQIMVRDFVREAHLDMNHSWGQFLSQVLSMLVFGWAFHEVVYKRRIPGESRFADGRIGWRKFAIRAQESLSAWELDDHGGINGLWQQPLHGGKRVFIPIQKALLFRVGRHRGSPEGRSLLRNAYRSWFFTKRLQEIEAIAMERDLVGLPVASVPPVQLTDAATAEEKQLVADLKELVQKVRIDERAGLVVPAEEDEDGKTGYGFKLMASGGTHSLDISGTIVRYEQRIALTLLTQFLMLGMEKVGSFALSRGHETIFGAAVGAIMDEIAEIVNRFALPPLMRLNGFPPETWPVLVHGEVDSPELGQLASYMSALTSAGLIRGDGALEQRLREFGALPPRETDAGQSSRVETAKTIIKGVAQGDLSTRQGMYLLVEICKFDQAMAESIFSE